MIRSAPQDEVRRPPELSARQASVLRAVVAAYVGDGSPVGSRTLTHVLPESLSSASVRSTLAELSDLGLVEKPHASAGRIPTDRGLRLFVDRLLDPGPVEAYEKRAIAYTVDEAEDDAVVHVASQLLSDRTRQLGFVVAPRIEHLVLRHVSLVRLTRERVLVVLVSQTGEAHRRVIDADAELDQAKLDRIAALLAERAAGRTLTEVRASLAAEARAIRHHADRLLRRAVELGLRALHVDDAHDLVIATRLALLDQPEFQDSRRVRDLFEALETKESLVDLLDEIAERGASVAFGEEVGEPRLFRCAVVAARYGSAEAPLGTLGVIGPTRMDYRRILPLVDYLAGLITDKLKA